MPDATDTLKTLLTNQYEAALATLHLAVARCPDALWDRPVANWLFCQAAFHAVMFTDLYLQPTGDEEVFKLQPFHLGHAANFGTYEELADRPLTMRYAKPFVSAYLGHARAKARETVAAESAETLAGPSGFSYRKCSRAELHVYNIRHVQHHAAQLSLRLRLDGGIDVPWVSHAWRDA